MARIAGINIPPHKHTEIGLTSIYGIGRNTAQKICSAAGIPFNKKIKELTDGDLESDRLPPRLKQWRRKLFGLTIDPERLQQIRQERRPDSRYARLETCRREVQVAEAMFALERIPTLSTTHTSIEEISSKVLSTLGLQREMF